MLQENISYVFTGILFWDSKLTGGCSSHSCAVNEKCVRKSFKTYICGITDCGFLSQVYPQYEDVSGGDTYRLIGVGARRKVNCRTGYQRMDKSVNALCRSDGVWIQPSNPCIALECKITTNGEEYRGHTSLTKHGLTCQRWDKKFPHDHDRDMMLDGPAALHENYCRNPDSEQGGPWCYTTDRLERWQFCEIAVCVK